MEIVNTTSVSPEKYLGFLLKGGGLKQLIGSTSCACFVVTRPIDTPHFFDHLIENVTTVDSTTRQYIAFVVFHGESTVYARASRYHEPYQLTQAQLIDISFSQCNHKRFDEDYASLFRNQPQHINRNKFSQHMMQAADMLMDYFQLQEHMVPCLVFVDPDSINHLIIRLPDRDSFNYMYKYILTPLSDAFRDLQGWLQSKHKFLEIMNLSLKYENATNFLKSVSVREESIKDSIQAIERELESVNVQGLPEMQRNKMELAQNELLSLDAQLKAIEQKVKEDGDTSAITLQRKRLEKRKHNCLQKIDSFKDSNYLRNLKHRLKQTESSLKSLILERDRNLNTVKSIPENIDELLKATKEEFDQYTSKSLSRGYDWIQIYDKSLPNNYYYGYSSIRSPKAFDVVGHVLKNLLEIVILPLRESNMFGRKPSDNSQSNEQSNMTGLIKISGCDNPSRRGDVVFVHGLAGHLRETWHWQNPKDENYQKDNFWLTWLAEDLKKEGIDVGIWSFGYDAARFAVGGFAMPLFDQASNLLDDLENENLGERPIIFVTHSMGGLAVKKMLNRANNFLRVEKKKVILQSTKGIVFLSTPHLGADVAKWVKFVTSFFGVQLATVNVQELESHAPQLRELDEWYRQHVDHLSIQTKVYYETRPTQGVLIVDADSANPSIRDVMPISVEADHNTISKPNSKDQKVYKGVKNFIADIFQPIPSLPPAHDLKPLPQTIPEKTVNPEQPL